MAKTMPTFWQRVRTDEDEKTTPVLAEALTLIAEYEVERTILNIIICGCKVLSAQFRAHHWHISLNHNFGRTMLSVHCSRLRNTPALRQGDLKTGVS